MRRRTVSRRALLRGLGAMTATALAGCATDRTAEKPPPETTGGPSTDPTLDDLGPLALEPVATGFGAPVDFVDPPGTEPRFVADQSGLIVAVGRDGSTDPVLDLRERVVTGGERGLLGLACHPAYAETGRLFVRYSAPRRPGTPRSFDHTFVLAEFEAAGNGNGIDPATERTLLEIPQPQSNHNAGSLGFGPDGYLYVGVGDGGAANDIGRGHAEDWYPAVRGGNGQDTTTNLLGSILRLDVDDRPSTSPYGIPEDNPLVGEPGLDEHYAWGLRNPWRFSFDGADLYVGDVGQSAYEEVNLVTRGGNYGWNVKEGSHCFGTDDCPDETPAGDPLLDPVIEYPHSDAAVSGVSVIGGYVVRGDSLPALAGRYLFGDLQPNGRLFVADRADRKNRWPTGTIPIAEADRSMLRQLLSFGRDAAGRLYVLGRGGGEGGVYELRPTA